MSKLELKFDKEMNLELALSYLNQNKELHSIGFQDNGIIEENEHHINIYYSNYVKSFEMESESLKDIYESLITLSDLIDQNKELFCQLEYLIRKIPMEHVRRFDLDLIKHNLIYNFMYGLEKKAFDNVIEMDDESPLAVLGLMMGCQFPLTIVATKITASVCSLFVNLCSQAGLQGQVRLCIEKDINNLKRPLLPLQLHLSNKIIGSSGCVGVVTEKADIDSAVDTFISASDQKLWRIKKIFVQESAIKRFARALEWKSNKKPSIENYIQTLASDAYQYEKKIFVYEFVGKEDINIDIIFIESFRTIKELLVLLKSVNCLCASIWSNDVAESNEISHNIVQNIVWVNGYGFFENTQFAKAFSSNVLYYSSKMYLDSLLGSDYVKSVMNEKSEWTKLDKLVRFKTVCEWLNDLKIDLKFLNGNRFALDSSDSSVDIGQRICITINRPVEFILIDIKLFRQTMKRLGIVKYLIDGGGIIFIYNQFDENVKQILKVNNKMKQAIFAKEFREAMCPDRFVLYESKVISSSIGTVFAN